MWVFERERGVCVCVSVCERESVFTHLRGHSVQFVFPWLHCLWHRPANMNLFCFTLEGSTESIYEPPNSQTLFQDVHLSPSLHRCKTEWGGSDPSIHSDRPPSTVKVKKNNRRSCVPTSPLDNETLVFHSPCCMSSRDKKGLSQQMKEVCKGPCRSSMWTRDDRVKGTQAHLPDKGGETAADTAESTHTTGRFKKLQNLVQTKTGHQSGGGRRTSENNDHMSDVLSIGLGRRTEKKPSETAPSPQTQHQAQDIRKDSVEDEVWGPWLGNYRWNPFECPQPWTPFYHTCHQPGHELWVCGGTWSLPRTTEWDRFESLIQELDSKQSDLSPKQMMHSNTDLQLSQNTLTRFGRFEACTQPSPLMKPRDIGGALTGNTQNDEAEKREVGGGRPFSKGHRRSSNSLESLYSLHSGQSSSSGVTSGSGCSSNRDSLRLEDDLLSKRQFCGRATVHTDFVPSPYDTESLKLMVGDVIDIIAKPPMGIWTGMLNGRVGNFKFIYVDVLTEKSPDTHKETQAHRLRHKSTVQEVLKRLSLEEHFLSLQLNGYQTVEDLMMLREHHLTELNVTDPEHRHRLLGAVHSLQQMRSDHQLENEAQTPSENTKAGMNNCPRDSGCHMPSDSPDNSAEDTDLHFLSEYPLPAQTTAS
ncbi:SAM domain-containing protein SAMSN-1b isoform X3 [Etheostoma cragini]|uniref:SAM domain-containing protein SAMSN-1b isoform X3 n=1 Tax=Etheostoma cragini TaxID=417921 RepID=UPI00155E48DF|nr:SAM domain-containing protein SAMSN-1b isoform X3 [Etheostoma cragini]